MKARTGILILFVTLSLIASWMLGYHEGQQTGAFHLLREMDETFELDRKAAADIDRDQVCDEIRSYKLSMARDLDENTQICGWPDMDDGKNSN